MTQDKEPLSFIQVLTSVMASFFGVQKNATRKRDFTRGRARDFILVGLLLTAAFVLLIWLAVKLAMHFAA